jgi:hypothetical protein
MFYSCNCVAWLFKLYTIPNVLEKVTFALNRLYKILSEGNVYFGILFG